MQRHFVSSILVITLNAKISFEAMQFFYKVKIALSFGLRFGVIKSRLVN